MIENVKSNSGFEMVELARDMFTERGVPGLTKDRILVGANCSSDSATGFGIQPIGVQENVETYIAT